MKELYELYGEAMIALEIAQNRVNQIKQQIANELNKPKVPEVVKEP